MDGILKIKQKIAALLKQAAEHAQQEGKLPQVALPEIIVERPQNSGHGDYASSLPLKLARSIGKNPIAIAQAIAELIPAAPELASVTVAPPGFINFTLRSDWLSKQVAEILDAGENFGDVAVGKGQSVQVEFVSANPTGPLHVGHGRGAVLGSTIANIGTSVVIGFHTPINRSR